jgi:hypothetical protein
MAEVFAEGNEIIGIDAESGSMSSFADTHRYAELLWKAPFDPRELTLTIRDLANGIAQDGVIIIDSGSRFWNGPGGTLDMANNPGRAGWDAQFALVNEILNAPCHVIVCLRAKLTYELEDGPERKGVAKFGLGPVQSDDFEYDMGVVATMDMDHRIDVTKSRCPTVEGKSFPPDHQGQLAELYAEWLSSGEMKASQTDIDALVYSMELPEDKGERAQLKQAFIKKFGSPSDLVESQVPGAQAWVKDNIADSQISSPAGRTGDPPLTPPSESPTPPGAMGSGPAGGEVEAA